MPPSLYQRMSSWQCTSLNSGVRQRPLLVYSLDSVAYVGALSPVTKIMHMANRHCSLFRDVGLESHHRCKGGFKGVGMKLHFFEKQTRHSSAPFCLSFFKAQRKHHRNFWFVRVTLSWMQLSMPIFSVCSNCHLGTWNMRLGGTTKMWHPTLVRFPFECSPHRCALNFITWASPSFGQTTCLVGEDGIASVLPCSCASLTFQLIN